MQRGKNVWRFGRFHCKLNFNQKLKVNNLISCLVREYRLQIEKHSCTQTKLDKVRSMRKNKNRVNTKTYS